jgi:AAA15 family ATPase/GTPase
MLIEFNVKNYKSFLALTNLSLEASTISELKENIVHEKKFKLELLKTLSIYGANSSGKTNILDALAFMKAFILDLSPISSSAQEIPVTPFKFQPNNKLPSLFEVTFLFKNRKYVYGFELSSKKVKTEWLIYYPKSRPVSVFHRSSKNIIVGSQFRRASRYIPDTVHNKLFLSVIDRWGVTVAQDVIQWLTNYINVISGIYKDNYAMFSIESTQNPIYQKKILDFIKIADPSIQNLHTEITDIRDEKIYRLTPPEKRQLIWPDSQLHKYVRVKISHRNQQNGSVELELQEESDGTQKIFALSGPIIRTLELGGTLVIDELDSQLHPLLQHQLVKLFNSNKTNRKNAQLIFTTHNTSVLSDRLLRRDQILFVEKNKDNASEIYSLSDYKYKDGRKIRKDASFEKDYLTGEYGAIPKFE